MNSEIEAVLAELEWDFPPGAALLFQRYLTELLFWNRKVGLVKSTEKELVSRHLRDSLVALPVIKRELLSPGYDFGDVNRSGRWPRLVDIGSGGGFPGIPLAISLPGFEVSLVERSGRKAGFLRNAVALLGLADRVEVLQEDARQLPARWDLALSRAFMPLSGALELMLDTLLPGGTALVYAGRVETVRQELSLLSEKGSYDEEAGDATIIPIDSGERTLVMLLRQE